MSDRNPSDGDAIPVCIDGTPYLVPEKEYFGVPVPQWAVDAVMLERDEFGRLICPACGNCYGKEWPGV